MSPLFHMGVSKKRLASAATAALQGRRETVLARFCESPYGKGLAAALLREPVPVRAVIRADQLDAATALLRDARVPVALTAELASRPTFRALLARAACVVVPVWPSTADDDAASELAAECGALAAAAQGARGAHVVVLCPATRHAHGACGGPDTAAGRCVSCAFEGCVAAFRAAVPRRRLTVLYHEPDMQSPVLLHALPALLLHRVLPLPLGAGAPDAPALYASFAAAADVVDAVVAVCRAPQAHGGHEYRLTGTKALTGAHIARTLARVVGEDVRYVPAAPADTFAALVQARDVPRAGALLYAACLGAPTPDACCTQHLRHLLATTTTATGTEGQEQQQQQHGGRRQPLSFGQWARQRRALLLSGTPALADVDLDAVLARPAAVRALLAAAVRGERVLHTEISAAELVLGDVVGAGACAVVYRAQYRGAPVAVKQFRAAAVELDGGEIARELAVLALLRHPHLVRCVGACTRRGARVCVVLEYVPRGSLDALLRAPTPAGALPLALQRGFAADIARALRFVHRAGLIHGDLKPANLLVTDALRLKLTDFGTCRVAGPAVQGAAGTPVFIAPEYFAKKAYTPKVDVYAYGITLWEIATRREPYADVAAAELPMRVAAGLRPDALPAHPLHALMQRCWHARPHRRPAFDAVLAELAAAHPETVPHPTSSSPPQQHRASAPTSPRSPPPLVVRPCLVDTGGSPDMRSPTAVTAVAAIATPRAQVRARALARERLLCRRRSTSNELSGMAPVVPRSLSPVERGGAAAAATHRPQPGQGDGGREEEFLLLDMDEDAEYCGGSTTTTPRTARPRHRREASCSGALGGSSARTGSDTPPVRQAIRVKPPPPTPPLCASRD